MKICVALFRGTNVGGKHRLPRMEFVAILERLGAQEVRTYIQSGNAGFLQKEAATSTRANRIGREIRKRCGFKPQILLLGLDELNGIIRRNPFPDAEREPTTLHTGFPADVPAHPDMQALEALRSEGEQSRLVDRVFYLHAPDDVKQSKLAARSERLLGVPMTDRNWRSVTAIREMAEEVAQKK